MLRDYLFCVNLSGADRRTESGDTLFLINVTNVTTEIWFTQPEYLVQFSKHDPRSQVDCNSFAHIVLLFWTSCANCFVIIAHFNVPCLQWSVMVH